jgi:uncharacterized integral membrane protein
MQPMRSNRLRLLMSGLISIAIAALLLLSLSYAAAHRYEERFEWLSSRTTQPLAFVILAAFVTGMVLAVAGLRQKPMK